jgi:branched-chain amino acid transport system ATP-binding protein
MPAVLEAQGLRKSFGGVHAVRDLSLSVGAGEVVAMIGPNGAGKSTSFNMLNGQISPDAGSVRVDGRDTAAMNSGDIWRLGVGRTFQVAATFRSMSVGENIETAILSRRGVLALWGGVSSGERERAERLLSQVGLAGAGHRPCASLPYGDLKRLEFAIALANDPKLLLMDEPTAGMGGQERAELMRTVTRIAKSSGIGVLFTEHDMAAVFGHADRILVLDRGRLIAEGPPEAIRTDPVVRATYLGERRAPEEIARA